MNSFFNNKWNKTMKINQFLKGMLLVAGALFAGAAMADEAADAGKKIYDRTMGRGCATCHEGGSNPDLFLSVNKLNRDEFVAVLKNGRNAMPKVMPAIMGVAKGMTEDQAVDALIAYLKQGK